MNAFDSMMVCFKAENLRRLASDPADICLKVSMESKTFKYCEILCQLFFSYWSPRKQQKNIKLHMRRMLVSCKEKVCKWSPV